ncbi:MAG: alpha-1,4-glucan--maltose-1-phosphate maltosyltransferase [Chthoniobacterales bacterium]|nr:alpha-1,4-glucan--maltose-1-phosphate maltosyltransferase [Chthoniobacterales bacterium]
MNKTTMVIENVQPLLDCGRYAVKRVAGQTMRVTADVFKDGHDVIAVVLKWRPAGAKAWRETPMKHEGNDAWSGVFSLVAMGDYEFTIEAWPDAYASWREEFAKKHAGGQPDLSSEALEGAHLLEAGAKRAGRRKGAKELRAAARELSAADRDQAAALAAREDLAALMAGYPDRSLSAEFRPCGLVTAERPRALFAAWYEFFPRSAEGLGERGSTFRDCIGRLDDAKAMGFDVVYFPPIHPIGATKRKGANNSLESGPDDPGVPYAIGNRHQGCPHGGGHRDVAPELGTLEDFEWLVGEAAKRGMEVALDFALNCSPDHPYVADHPEWFFHRPDGSIKYAENPPKKYEDVYPLDYHNADWRALWEELKDLILWWAERGVRTFRVDNPHTKPVSFWEWLIAETRRKFPDLVFLSEAFTRPKMMRVLAKIGFTQSYTYFTWRNTKSELTEYFTELTTHESAEYMRPNLFANTPDILPFFLQQGGRPAFMIRAVLAATLSPVYGIYSGFELCENAALPGREEYLDSEKYQLKPRDWNAPGNIKGLVTALNRIRRENRALQELANLTFLPAESDQILFYAKATPALDNILLVAVILDPWHAQSAWVEVPLEQLGLAEDETFQVHDLLTDERFLWRGRRNFVMLDPHGRPAHVFRVRRRVASERGFDHYE